MITVLILLDNGNSKLHIRGLQRQSISSIGSTSTKSASNLLPLECPQRLIRGYWRKRSLFFFPTKGLFAIAGEKHPFENIL